MKKNVVIVILLILVLGMGGYLVYDKVIDKDVDKKENNTEKVENSNIDSNENNCISVEKYIGTYIGENGTDSIIIKSDGTYEFERTLTDNVLTENKNSKGLVISNGVYLALVEFYDTYSEDSPYLNSYYFYIDGKNLKLFGDKTTDSTIFIKK